jgi:hypothetical protein
VSGAYVDAIREVTQTFLRSDAAGTPPWLRYFDEAHMAAKFGHCFHELGRGDKAELFARRSLDVVDGHVRGRAFNVVLLANAHLQPPGPQPDRRNRRAAPIPTDQR